MPFVTMASGSHHALHYVVETSPGVTPNTPTVTALTHTSCSLNLSRDTLQSNALRSDRMIPFVRTGTDKVQGDIAFELCAGEYDTLFEAALFGAWTNNEVKAGRTVKTFTIERAFTDIGQYGVFRGCHINQLSLSVKPNAMITGTFSMMGLTATYSANSLSANPIPATNSPPFDSYTGSLKENGTEIAVVTGLDLTLANNINPQYGLFSRSALAVPAGRSNLSGTMAAFFINADLLSRFINETPASLEFTLTHGETSYTFTIPNIVYTGADNPVQDEGVIQLSMPWQAVLDATLGSNIKITRALAPEITES